MCFSVFIFHVLRHSLFPPLYSVAVSIWDCRLCNVHKGTKYILLHIFPSVFMRGGCVVVQLSEAHERRVCKQRAGIGAVRDILLFVRVRKSE